MLKKNVSKMDENENNAFLCSLIIKTFKSELVKVPFTAETRAQVKSILDEFLLGMDSRAYIEKSFEERACYLEEVINRALASMTKMTGDENV